MEKLNQLLFIIFSLFLLGIYLSTIKKTENERHPYFSDYWPLAILSRASAFLIWAVSPILGSWTLVFANTLYLVSLISLLFTLRSWRIEISSPIKFIAVVTVVSYVIAYEYILHHFDGFLYRAYLLTFLLLLISGFEIRELIINLRKDRAPLLKLLLILAFIQFALAVFALNMISNNSNPAAKSIVQNSAEGMIGFWLAFGTQLVFYIFISSFLYQKLWESEKKAHDQLKENRLKLTSVTKEKEAVAELLKERDALVSQLLRANKTVTTGALSASIAHEINQPLTVIQINVQLLRELMDVQNEKADPKMQLELVEEILKNNQRATNVVRSLRSIFSEQTQDFEHVDVVQIIRSVLDISNAELNSKKITVDFKLPDSAFANVYPQEILQVILNLVNNAVASLSESSQTYKNIVVELAYVDEQIQISITDNGPGVSQANESQLFELLADSKRTGMGLGLWLCKYVISRHQGLIWHEHVVDGGAKFCLQFPTNLISYKIQK
jgi:signal transduction histidine kinase